MSSARARIQEMAGCMSDEKLEEVVDFMSFILSKEDGRLQKDMLLASESSLEFWDNPDDEVWNDV